MSKVIYSRHKKSRPNVRITSTKTFFDFDEKTVRVARTLNLIAGDIKESRIIAKYELGKNSKGKYQSKVGRDLL